MWLGGVSDLSAYAEQEITIESADLANLTFEMFMATGAPLTATATLTVSMDGTTIAVYTEADLASYNGYTTVALDVSAYADGGAHMLRFDFLNPTSENFNIVIDEVSVVAIPAESLTCNVIGNIDWLGVSPSSGSLSPGQTDLVVTYDAAGLGDGVYTDTLCINSNDPDEPVLNVPVTMTVGGDPPTMVVDTVAITASLTGADQVSATISITNTGDGALDWTFGEVDGASAGRAALDTHIEEGFEDGVPPTGWTISDTTGTSATWESFGFGQSSSNSAGVPYK